MLKAMYMSGVIVLNVFSASPIYVSSVLLLTVTVAWYMIPLVRHLPSSGHVCFCRQLHKDISLLWFESGVVLVGIFLYLQHGHVTNNQLCVHFFHHYASCFWWVRVWSQALAKQICKTNDVKSNRLVNQHYNKITFLAQDNVFMIISYKVCIYWK